MGGGTNFFMDNGSACDSEGAKDGIRSLLLKDGIGIRNLVNIIYIRCVSKAHCPLVSAARMNLYIIIGEKAGGGRMAR